MIFCLSPPAFSLSPVIYFAPELLLDLPEASLGRLAEVFDLTAAVGLVMGAVDLAAAASFQKWSVFPEELLNVRWNAAF